MTERAASPPNRTGFDPGGSGSSAHENAEYLAGRPVSNSRSEEQNIQVDLEAEMLRLERLMYSLDWRDPKRRAVVRQYDAVCDKLGVPSGDK